MTVQPVAIGIGCRLGCPAEAIEGVIRMALQRVPDGRATGLFTIADKHGEAGMITAARALGFPLIALPRETLRAQAASVETKSPASEAAFAVPSVAEAAALAGYGEGAVLLVARVAKDGADDA